MKCWSESWPDQQVQPVSNIPGKDYTESCTDGEFPIDRLRIAES
jgi:hypothetical protein